MTLFARPYQFYIEPGLVDPESSYYIGTLAISNLVFMANLQGMSGIDVRAVTVELAVHLPLWVNKVYQFDDKLFGIRLNAKEHRRFDLLIESGKRVHLTGVLPVAPKNPPSFAMLLRKYLNGGRIINFGQHSLERIFFIDIQKSDGVYRLIAELYDEGNIILLDKEGLILKPLRHHRFKDRDVVPGVKYEFSPIDVTRISEEEFEALLKSDNRDIVRALATRCLLGGLYAEYICSTAKIEKNCPVNEIKDFKPLYDSFNSLIHRVDYARSPCLLNNSVLPFPLLEMSESVHFESFNEALDNLYPKEEVLKEEKGPKASHKDIIRARQEAAVKKFSEKINHFEAINEKIYENYSFIEETIQTLRSASKTHSWQEISEVLKKSTLESAKKIKGVHPAEAAVDLDLGITVRIYVSESVNANLGRYYDEIKRFKRKREGAKRAMEQPVARKKEPKSSIKPAKKRWFHKFRWFYTTDSVLVLGGRDATQNEELVKKYMEGKDRFVHADVHGASVVIVKGESSCMDEVARFAASYSGSWKSGHFSADVYSVASNQVTKTPESGEYISKGSFIVRGEREYQRDVPLGIMIGVQISPEAMVIGGPQSAICKSAIASVLLKPGTFEPNDVAKKVIRELREQLGPQKSQEYKAFLTTERIAAFVPPGGSDIEGSHEGG